MRIATIIISAVALGTVIGTAWAMIEVGNPGDDLQAMLDRLQEPATLGEMRGAGSAVLVVEGGNEFDFGIMDLSDTASHTFVLRNEGAAPLMLELLGTTCKCAIGTLPDGAIPPGGSGEVTLEWTAKGETDQYRQSATIETSDPLQRVLYLSVSGKVLQIVRALPRSVIFTDIPATEPRSASFDLLNFKQDQFEIEEVTWDDPELANSLELSYQPMSADDLDNAFGAKSGYRCQLTVQPGLPMGTFQNLLTLTLSAANKRSLQVPVRGNVVTDIRIAGPGYRDRIGRLELGLVPPAGISRQLLILAKGPYREGLEIDVGKIEPEGVLTASVGAGQPLNQGAVWKFPLEVTVLPTDQPINHRVSADQEPARLTLHTNHPIAKEIEVSVSFAVGRD